LRQSVARAEHAERQVSRVVQLRQMSGAQLAALFADPEAAGPWIEAAAACGIAEAQVRLGRMLLEGRGVAHDERAALRWFLQAARAGHADAQNMVARGYELGWGCEVDLPAAALWYARAAASGHAWGEYNYANMLFDGRGIAQNQPAAVAYYRRAARRGHARAMNLLARCMEEGWGTAKDMPAAAHWYRQSAEGGYFRAQFNHAVELLRQGDTSAASLWLTRARVESDGPMQRRIDRLAQQIQAITGSQSDALTPHNSAPRRFPVPAGQDT